MTLSQSCQSIPKNFGLEMSSPQTAFPKESIIAALWNKVQEKPNFTILSWVDDQCNEVNSLTYSQLWKQSGAVQRLLHEKNVKPGDCVMVCYPFGLEFLAGLFGCMRAGVIPCSVYPPNPKQPKNSIKTFANMAKDAATIQLPFDKYQQIHNMAATEEVIDVDNVQNVLKAQEEEVEFEPAPQDR